MAYLLLQRCMEIECQKIENKAKKKNKELFCIDLRI